MRKVLILAAALVLCAGQALAQQQADAAAVASPVAAVQAAPAPQVGQPEQQKPVPSIYVSTEEVRRQVRAAEAQRAEAQVGSRDWWYLVAAIAVGVIVALILLD